VTDVWEASKIGVQGRNDPRLGARAWGHWKIARWTRGRGVTEAKPTPIVVVGSPRARVVARGCGGAAVIGIVDDIHVCLAGVVII
jgi:hypothetical protein